MAIGTAFLRIWKRIESWALHPDLFRDPVEARKARLMLVTCLASGPACLGVIIDGWFVSPDFRIATGLIGMGHILVCSCFLLLRWCSKVGIPAMAMTLVACGQLLNATWWTDGFESPVLFAYPLVTVFVGLIGGRWHSLVATLILSIGAIIILSMDMHGVSMGEAETAPEVVLATLIWAILTGSGMALFTQYQTDALLDRASEEVRQRRAAQEQAERANHDKDMFMAYMSHEIRNPLAVIMGTVDLASIQQEPSQQKRHLEVMRLASHGLATMLDDVLDFASMQRGRLQVRKDRVDLVVLLDDIVNLYRPQAERAHLALSFQHNGPKPVLGDTVRLRQVLSNLVSNALKYTKEGSVRLELTNSEGSVRVSVEDTGPGIEPSKRKDIFEPYERGQTGDIPGTGLGLSVSQALLHRMDSELIMEHPPSGGCRFHFSLREAPDEPVSAIPVAIRRVLVVDDNQEAANLLAAMLSQFGCEVHVSFDGEQALRYLEDERADLLLLDVDMPGITGPELARRVSERFETMPPIIWFVTGNPMVKLGDIAQGILMKPVDPAALRQVLSRT